MRTTKPCQSITFQVRGHNPCTGAKFQSFSAATLKEARKIAKRELDTHTLENGYPTHVTITKIVEFVFPR